FVSLRTCIIVAEGRASTILIISQREIRVQAQVAFSSGASKTLAIIVLNHSTRSNRGNRKG
ncbi:MAG: hypothetical protein KDD64_10670, partial [Bdellovibrionales bacterium]|nr:hypothetical protein [Bdellovibrionales bacterium]